MNWKQIVVDLNEAGMTQEQIAEECGVAQATVSDLHLGKTKSPGFDFGDKLRALHGSKVSKAQARRVAA